MTRGHAWTRVQHRWGPLGQRLLRPDVAVIGGYHFANAGDIALGVGVKGELPASLGRSALQTIYQLQRFPKAGIALLGGGAIGTELGLQQLRSRYSDARRVAIVGVDFDIKAVEANTQFLANVPFISTRSHEHAAQISEVLGKPVVAHPDLSFANHRLSITTSARRNSNSLAVNIAPQLVTQEKGRFVDRRTMPAALVELDGGSLPNEVSGAYRRWIRSIVVEALDQGRQVCHIPFTPTDDAYAREVFSGLPMRYRGYTTAPQRLLNEIAQHGAMVSGRFHSTMFAVMAQTPLLPYAYALKCLRTISDMEAYGLTFDWVKPRDVLDLRAPSLGDALFQTANTDGLNAMTTEVVRRIGEASSLLAEFRGGG